MEKVYDSIIIGAGPAGISTAIYNSRGGLKTALVERGLYGGTLHDTDTVENYISYDSISGPELAKNMEDHVKIQEGVDHLYGNVKGIDMDGFLFVVDLGKKKIKGKTVVLATGIKYRNMNIPGEKEYKGRGVSNCVTCDVSFFKNKEIFMIGGGDSAVEGALYASNVVEKVTLIHRRGELRADKTSQRELFKRENIDVVWNADTKEIIGEKGVFSGIEYTDKNSGEQHIINGSGAFINVGVVPATEPFRELGILNEEGYVVTNFTMESGLEGLYAVGDIRENSIKQVVSATSDGAVASKYIIRYLNMNQMLDT